MTATATETELLGEVVTWDLKSQIIPITAIRDALEEAGLDPDAAADLKPRSAFTRACKHLKDERAIDKLDTNGGVYTFQFTRKSMGQGKVDYNFEALVKLDTDSGEVSCDESPEIAEQARELIAHAMQTRTSQDVTRLVQRQFQEHADLYPINPRKGVAYFVPEQHRDFTEKIDKFLHALGGGLSRFPVPKGTPEGNRSVQEAVYSGLSAMLDELNSAVENWDDDTRKDTVERALERYQIIQHKVECYQEFLGAQQSRLREAIEEAKTRLVDRLTSATDGQDTDASSDGGVTDTTSA